MSQKFESNLAAAGGPVTLAEVGGSLAGASAVDPSRSYLVSPLREGGFSASVIENGTAQEVYKGASREEATLSIQCREAQAAGIETLQFHNAETGVPLKDSKYLLKGSRYLDKSGNAIEIDAANPGKFNCFDRSGAAVGSFSNASLATSYLSVLSAEPAALERARNQQKAPAIGADKASVKDTSFTLAIAKRPALTQTADGYALMVLTGTEKTAEGVRARSVPVRGDQARLLDQMFNTRSFDKPVEVAVEATLKPQRLVNAGSGVTRTALVAEAKSVKLVAARAKELGGLAA